jgi:hypothetical protein
MAKFTTWKSRAKTTPTATLPMAPTILFATIANITDAVPNAMIRAYERMWPKVDSSSMTATMPSSAMRMGKATRTAIANGVKSADGSNRKAARSDSTVNTTITVAMPRPSASRRCPRRHAVTTASTSPRVMCTTPIATDRARNGMIASSRLNHSGRIPTT